MPPYKVVKVIDGGAFATIELVADATGAALARKLFKPKWHPFPEQAEKLRQRFIREAKTQAALAKICGGKLIMPIVAMHLDEFPPSFLMPVADRNFEGEINAHGALPSTLATPLLHILESLEFIHSYEYVHRDLKPANVLFHDGRWKLADFGLVLPRDGTTKQLSSQGSSWGTEEYAAPEIRVDFHNAKSTADIYSFGCILHDIFGDKSIHRIPYARATASGSVGRVIEKCTEVVPGQRFQNVASVRQALIAAAAHATLPTRASTPDEITFIGYLAAIPNWSRELYEEFARYLESLVPRGESEPVLLALDERHFSQFVVTPWGRRIAESYSRWISGTAFTFSFCDVLVQRMAPLVSSGDLGGRALALVSLAKMGHSHNRYYVMGAVLVDCSPTMDTALAERLAVEILIEDARAAFYACAQIMGRPLQAFHPRIVDVLIGP